MFAEAIVAACLVSKSVYDEARLGRHSTWLKRINQRDQTRVKQRHHRTQWNTHTTPQKRSRSHTFKLDEFSTSSKDAIRWRPSRLCWVKSQPREEDTRHEAEERDTKLLLAWHEPAEPEGRALTVDRSLLGLSKARLVPSESQVLEALQVTLQLELCQCRHI